jgi:hypothetical protein
LASYTLKLYKYKMKTLLQMEKYYVREYTPICSLLKIWVSLLIFKNLQLECILHYIPYFTDNRSMGTIGRIAAFQLNFLGNTKIGRGGR